MRPRSGLDPHGEQLALPPSLALPCFSNPTSWFPTMCLLRGAGVGWEGEGAMELHYQQHGWKPESLDEKSCPWKPTPNSTGPWRQMISTDGHINVLITVQFIIIFFLIYPLFLNDCPHQTVAATSWCSNMVLGHLKPHNWCLLLSAVPRQEPSAKLAAKVKHWEKALVSSIPLLLLWYIWLIDYKAWTKSPHDPRRRQFFLWLLTYLRCMCVFKRAFANPLHLCHRAAHALPFWL